MREVALVLVLTVTIVFGLWKQVKTAVRSTRAMVGTHLENGDDARYLKIKFEETTAEFARQVTIAYISDHANGNRRAEEFYYAAQYGFAPYLIHKDSTDADYFLLDFMSQDSIRKYADEKKLSIIEQRGLMALASRAPSS